LLLRRAAEPGSAEAALALGETLPDAASAQKWYQRAAELGQRPRRSTWQSLSLGRVTKAIVIVHEYPALLRARRRRERWTEQDYTHCWMPRPIGYAMRNVTERREARRDTRAIASCAISRSNIFVRPCARNGRLKLTDVPINRSSLIVR
jgi:hypothetical protein